MKLETEDDPLVTSTFETRLDDYFVDVTMSLDYHGDFHGNGTQITLVRRLDKNDVVTLFNELSAWLGATDG